MINRVNIPEYPFITSAGVKILHDKIARIVMDRKDQLVSGISLDPRLDRLVEAPAEIHTL